MICLYVSTRLQDKMARFAGRVASLENNVVFFVLGVSFFHVFLLGVDCVLTNFAIFLSLD